MRFASAIGPTLLASLLLASGGGCDDPAPNRPAQALIQDTASSQASAAASASAAAVASATSAGPPGDAPPPAASAATPAVSGEAAASTPEGVGSADVPSAPRTGKSTARTGILTAAESDAILAAGAPARVVLLDAGAEPRAPTRYDFAPGAATGMEMGIAMTLEVAQGDRTAPPQSVPRITTLLDFATASAAKGGAVGIDATVKKVSIAEESGISKQIADRLLPMLKGVEGLSLHYEVTPSGRVKQGGAKIAGQKGNPAVDGTISQMTQSVESMIVAFPEEPIGLGARWEVISRFSSSGTDLLQWSTFRLDERDESGAKLALEVKQAAAKPEMTPPGAPPGFSAKLVEFASVGKGDTKLDLSSPAPLRSLATVESKMALSVAQGGGGGGTMKMKSQVAVEMKRAGKASAGKPTTATPPAAPKPAAPAPATP